MASKKKKSDTNSGSAKKTSGAYHCYDCGGVWDKNGVDIIQSKDSTKYVCKECRGRCLPNEELGKRKGVKSIRQRYSNRRIIVACLIIVLGIITYRLYDQRVTGNDYRNYLAETAKLRKSINPHLITFRDDYRLIETAKKHKVDNNKLAIARVRVSKAKRYIFSKIDEVERIEKPEKPEIIDLYNIETDFWKNPTYIGYITYNSTFKELEKKYGSDLFEFIKDQVRHTLEKKRKK